MPNHIINEVRINAGDKADAVLADILNADGRIDFGVLLPEPLNFWQGGYSISEQEAFPGVGMRWCTENWGTKWNAYGIDEDGRYQSVVREGGEITLTFQTAWATPRGWIVAIFNKHKVPITDTWLDEGSDTAHVEEYILEGRFDAPEWKKSDCGDTETRRMHKLLWGVEEFTDDD